MPKSSSDNTAEIVGVVSWGADCGHPESPNYPGVFTDVSRYLDWINFYM